MPRDPAIRLWKIRAVARLARPWGADVFYYQVLDATQCCASGRLYFFRQASAIIVVNYLEGWRGAQDLVARKDLYAAAIGTQRQAHRRNLAEPASEIGGYVIG